MLIEFWERLRGYDKWVATIARFESADLENHVHTDRAGNVSYTWTSFDTLLWTDTHGTEHSADFRVPDDSPIYQMIDGDKVTIRYNPTRPDRYYYRELLQTRVHTVLKIAFWTMFCAVLCGGLLWFSHRMR
jgi:hypothetical protein